MILYWDNYITDTPLYQSFIKANDQLRSSNTQYKMPKKIDIAKYTITSYAEIPWTNVIIKFDAEKKEDIDTFSQYALELFPNAEIIQPRSTNQKMFKETVEKIYNLQDDWIFYAGNNDHPLIASDLTHLYKSLEIANKFKQEYEFVSIFYSHFSEFINAPIIGSPFNVTYASDSHIVKDNDTATCFVRFNGDNSSIQIVHKDLLRYWFCSHDLGNERIIRAEDVRKFFLTPNQLMIVPKKELCAHFDGYSHSIGGSTEITPDKVPPLFIPAGFFDNSIRIAYGYPEYREGWVNINPAARDFSFRNQEKGTDLKIGLQDMPLFWRGKIKEVDVNINADFEKIEKGRMEYFQTVRNPWRESKSKFFNLKEMKNVIMRSCIDTVHIFMKMRSVRVPINEKASSSKDIARLAAIGLTLNSKKPLMLHFGCGPRILKGWINIDLSYTHYKDYMKYYTDKYYPEEIRGNQSDFYAIDITKTGLPLPDESVDVVFHEDFIEHLNQRDQIIFLVETFRVLKIDGIHRVNTPNLLSSMGEHSDFSKGISGVYLEEWNKHIHLNVLTPTILQEMALMVGYKKVLFNGRNQSTSKLIPLEYRPDPNDRPESGNIFADLIK